jgi:hypothetical protein
MAGVEQRVDGSLHNFKYIMRQQEGYDSSGCGGISKIMSLVLSPRHISYSRWWRQGCGAPDAAATSWQAPLSGLVRPVVNIAPEDA